MQFSNQFATTVDVQSGQILKYDCALVGGPSNHQGRLGEGGEPGVKSKGWGALLMGRSHGFLGLPAKKLGHVAGGARSLYMWDFFCRRARRASRVRFGRGPLQPPRKIGGGGRAGREEQGVGGLPYGAFARIPKHDYRKKMDRTVKKHVGSAAPGRGRTPPQGPTGTTIPKKNSEVPKLGGKTVWKGRSAAGPFSWDQNEAPCAWGLVCSCPGSAGADAQGPRAALWKILKSVRGPTRHAHSASLGAVIEIVH